ncbi:unnamed protein product, partial [Heterosigma akashiwo]
ARCSPWFCPVSCSVTRWGFWPWPGLSWCLPRWVTAFVASISPNSRRAEGGDEQQRQQLSGGLRGGQRCLSSVCCFALVILLCT